MTTVRRVFLATLFVSLAISARSESEFISLSDLHFNPYYDPSLMARLEATDVSGWDAVFASSKITAVSAYGADTNYPLLQSFLADLKTRAAGARFITITGDLLGHDFPQNFQLYSADKSEEAYQSFTTKTIQFIAAQIESATPSIPIFPVLGNNDSDCGDYEITPAGWFLSAFAKAWAPRVKSATFVKQFSPAGNYDVPAPIPDTRIIGLDSIFLSMSYDNACGEEGTDYGAQTLTWLRRRLAAAKEKHQRVWLLYHIPPGINVYSTTSAGSACPAPVLMWKSQYTKRFNALMKRYASTVVTSLAGHTHMDDFRLIDNMAIHITPAVSPMFTNNPTYESIAYSPTSGAITDYTAFHLQLAGTPAAWAIEYTFSTAYNHASLAAMHAAIAADPATRALYMQYYTSSNATSTTMTPKNWFGYWCGTGAANAAAFTTCYCVTPTAPSPPGSPGR
jgi:hypothetical protein